MYSINRSYANSPYKRPLAIMGVQLRVLMNPIKHHSTMVLWGFEGSSNPLKAPMKPIEHHSTMVPRSLRRALNWVL